jgi:hypothetical protein
MPIAMSDLRYPAVIWSALMAAGKSRASVWRWSNLRAIGNLSAAKLTVLIPLIGYMVIFNEKFLPYLQLSVHIFGGQADVGGQAQVSWRLIATYYGLCFLGVGSIIYQLFCPIEVKRFGTAAD